MNFNAPYSSLSALGENAGGIAAAHIDRAFRSLIRDPRSARDAGFVRVITGEPHPFGNFAVLADGSDAKAAERAIEPLMHCAAPAAVLSIQPVASEVAACLKAAGFEPHGGMPAMAVEIAALPATRLPTGYSFRSVGLSDSDSWTRAFADGYEIPHGVAQLFWPAAANASTASDVAVQYFAVLKEGRFVGTSMLFLDAGVAGIYCVSTILSERGKGLGAYATVEPLRMTQALGFRVAVLQSSAAGHSLYRKLGFADLGEVPLFIRMPG